MNKTLLLILCDFLLLNLLALTRWEKAEPPRTPPASGVSMTVNGVTKDQDLVAVMEQSLTDEKMQRDDLAKKLATADATGVMREQALAQTQVERKKLVEERNAVTATLTEAQRAAAELAKKFSAVTQTAALTQAQLVQVQFDLKEKRTETERQRGALTVLEQAQTRAREEIEDLRRGALLAEQEKRNMLEAADALPGQVEKERQERSKLLEANVRLAQGVGQLAEKSGELTQELRDNRPINAHAIFNDYLANRVTAKFQASRKGFMGQTNLVKEGPSVLVSDGRQTFALMHLNQTGFALEQSVSDWESLQVELGRGGSPSVVVAEVRFLSKDFRLVALPYEATGAPSARAFAVAVDPFKFAEAVLVESNGLGYGEIAFKVDPGEPSFVRVESRFFKRLLGEFSPKTGDLVFAKTGELLGMMVNRDYCAVLKNFAAFKVIRTGADIRSQATGGIFSELFAQWGRLPLKLQ